MPLNGNQSRKARCNVDALARSPQALLPFDRMVNWPPKPHCRLIWMTRNGTPTYELTATLERTSGITA